jgi:hypothetical protein
MFQEYQNNKLVMFNKSNFRDKKEYKFDDAGNIPAFEETKRELDQLKYELDQLKQYSAKNKRDTNTVNNQFPPLVMDWEEFENILIPKLDNVYLYFKNDEPIHGIKINKEDHQYDRNKYDITIYYSYEKLINIICHNDVFYIRSKSLNPLLGYQTKTITYFKKLASIKLDINIF